MRLSHAMTQALNAIAHEATVGHPLTRNTAEMSHGPRTIAALTVRGLVETYADGHIWRIRPVVPLQSAADDAGEIAIYSDERLTW